MYKYDESIDIPFALKLFEFEVLPKDLKRKYESYFRVFGQSEIRPIGGVTFEDILIPELANVVVRLVVHFNNYKFYFVCFDGEYCYMGRE